jgi:hypothetical protein
MTAIAFTENSLLNAKRALVASFPDEKSTHLTEALAAACGYGSHAALRADMLRQNSADPDFILLDDEAFIRRLNALTNTATSPNEDFGWFELLNYPSKDDVISTQSMLGEDAQYGTVRARAWRNAMVSAINAGISRRLFSVRPGDNRWPDAGDPTRREAHVFQFEIETIPAVGAVSDAGFDELSIHVALWPTPEAMDFARAYNAGFAAGEVFASGWLERRDGAWLQYPRKPDLRCRSHRLATLAALDIRPKGYADRGSFKM